MRLGNLTNIFDLPMNTARTDEAALVAELRAGSDEAFGWLIQQYHRPIYSLLARSVRDPADAADITQEVFLKVFRVIGSFHGESSLKTWIYRIALHEASNGQRWWSRHKKCEITLETCGCSSSADGEEDNATLGESLLKTTLQVLLCGPAGTVCGLPKISAGDEVNGSAHIFSYGVADSFASSEGAAISMPRLA